MNAFSSAFCPLTSTQYLTFFSSFLILPPSFCPVLVTGAAEGSQRVKEAHRGLMRTVLVKRVSSLGLCSCGTSAGVCTFIYVC